MKAILIVALLLGAGQALADDVAQKPGWWRPETPAAAAPVVRPVIVKRPVIIVRRTVVVRPRVYRRPHRRRCVLLIFC